MVKIESQKIFIKYHNINITQSVNIDVIFYMGNNLCIHDLIKTLHIIHIGYTLGYFIYIYIFIAVYQNLGIFRVTLRTFE